VDARRSLRVVSMELFFLLPPLDRSAVGCDLSACVSEKIASRSESAYRGDGNGTDQTKTFSPS
jgi:hypothetical protein